VKTYSDALSALGDPTRRAIFEHLGERPSAVVDLAALVPVSRPAVSQHLKVLKEAGLVRDVQVGTRRIYSLDPDGIVALRDYWTGSGTRPCIRSRRESNNVKRR